MSGEHYEVDAVVHGVVLRAMSGLVPNSGAGDIYPASVKRGMSRSASQRETPREFACRE